MKNKVNQRRRIIKELNHYNKKFRTSNAISWDEYIINRNRLFNVLIDDVELTDDQIDSMQKVRGLSYDVIRFRSFLYLIQLCSN